MKWWELLPAGTEVEDGVHTGVGEVTHVGGLIVPRGDKKDDAGVLVRAVSHTPKGVADGFVVSFRRVPDSRLAGSYPGLGVSVLGGAEELVLGMCCPISCGGRAPIERGGTELTGDS